MNSSSSIPGDVKELKGQFGVQGASAPHPSVIVEEEPEPDDYNYVVVEKDVDEDAFRQMTWTMPSPTEGKRLKLAVVAILAAAVVGWLVGMGVGSAIESSNDVKRKSSIASTVLRTVTPKLAGFETFAKDFERVASGPFNETQFNSLVRNYSRHNFMLDMSSEVTSEVLMLAGQGGANPLKDLRSFSANTMLLTQLLSIHVNETNADSEEIVALLEGGGSSEVIYAMRVNADALHYLGTTAPRESYANGVLEVFTLRGPILDDEETSREYTQLKIEQRWSQAQRQYRDYVPQRGESVLELPNRMLYRVMERSGRVSLLFADELLLINRKVLFGNAANALERYNRRTAEISKLIGEIRLSASPIESGLSVFVK
ncbi:MAG: hypothetical protein FWC40_07780 [Proteobacteria bacterium]|nr:hypothetical protein [Pseudomonadota bacterium]